MRGWAHKCLFCTDRLTNNILDYQFQSRKEFVQHQIDKCGKHLYKSQIPNCQLF